ncbi:MAG: hypothetical protein E2576_19980 [Alcaligenaceae bacterium]|nr:hypothetical protein [Alcaligenaceae bacterium SAGV5]MPS51577.1 hypothetical protein [Alcaligenaceae bacterium SAGV3]MPT59003.1 hypothetical protein [Alcaligenaceae bacterium]
MSSIEPASGARTVTIGAVGDLYLGKPLRGETDPGFAAAVQALRACDVRFANLEVQLLRRPTAAAAQAPGAWAGAPAALAGDVAWLGVNVASTANNHAGDYGAEGLRQTEETLRELGIPHAGTGADLERARRHAVVETPGGRVAVLAVSSSHLDHARAGRSREDAPGRPGVSPLRFGTRYRVDAEAYAALERILERLPAGHHREHPLARAYDDERGPALSLLGARFVRGEDFGVESWAAPDDAADIEAAVRAARRDADWVLLSMHTHEYDRRPDTPPDFAMEMARRAIDAGADAVIGHGAHGVRGVELYRGRPIFHGIGAFVFQPYLFPTQPADFFDAYAMRDQPLADVYRARRDNAGFYRRRSAWEALFVRLTCDRAGPPVFTLQPLTLWAEGAGPDGLPRLARNGEGLQLLEKVRDLSRELGTDLRLDAAQHLLHGHGASVSTQPRRL